MLLLAVAADSPFPATPASPVPAIVRTLGDTSLCALPLRAPPTTPATRNIEPARRKSRREPGRIPLVMWMILQ
jgi:hypothetical protein